jgi:hypothetical protein
MSEDDIEVLIGAVRSVLKRAVESAEEGSPTLRNVRYVQTVEKGEHNSLRGFQEARTVIDDSTFQMIDRNVMALLEAEVLPTVLAVPQFRLRFLCDARGIELPLPVDPTWLRNTLTASILSRYLERLPKELEWSEEVFDSVAYEFKNFMQSSTITRVNKTSLKNFNMNADSVELTPGLRIERVSWEEAKNLYEESQQFGMSNDGFEYAQIEFAVVHEIQVLPVQGMFHDNLDSHEIVGSLLCTLRILNQGFVQRGVTWTSYPKPIFILAGTSRSLPNRWGFAQGPPMELDVQNLSANVMALLDRMKAYEDSSLRIALRRFEFAYSRPQLEDQLIDIWIALEALFLDRGERSETTDKISRRMGRLLGSNAEDRSAIRRKAKELYNTRSRLVHGAHLDQVQILNSVTESLALLRLSLKMRLTDKWSVGSLESDMMK